jgi:hypothetical protein
MLGLLTLTIRCILQADTMVCYGALSSQQILNNHVIRHQ